MTEDVVLAERHGPVLVLTLNRPEKLNAWNDAMESRYYTLLDEAEADPEVRVVVLTGAGRGFCSGADMEDMAIVRERAEITIPQAAVPQCRPLIFKKPLIAAVNGAAAGIGLVHALYCDIRFASAEAKFTTSFSRRGLVAEYGASWLLPRIVGHSRAADLLLSGRVVKGTEAASIGLVDFVTDTDHLLTTALDYASDLASNCSPASMSTIKAQLFFAEENSFYAAFADADIRTLEAVVKPDLVEGVTSYLEGRPPAFPGLSFRQQ
ncbi:enoyl-CoA hydratase-related protein [Nocardia xishanensis]